MTTTLDLKHPEKAGTLGAGLLNLDAQVMKGLINKFHFHTLMLVLSTLKTFTPFCEIN